MNVEIMYRLRDPVNGTFKNMSQQEYEMRKRAVINDEREFKERLAIVAEQKAELEAHTLIKPAKHARDMTEVELTAAKAKLLGLSR